MNAWQATLVVLLAVLVGAAVPVLLQLRRTLRRAETFLDETGPRLQRSLDSVDRIALRADRITGDLEKDLDRARGLLESVAEFGGSLRQMQGSLRTVASVGAAIGPAVAAGARALFDSFRSEGRDAATAPRKTGGDAGSPAPARRPEEMSHE